ncbi:MAG TPA: hypothetical protein VEQ58_12345 [Polyangiaceae bacterium]|nr:hypothetical protein [Polyangiaceae bacterium]
MSGKLLSLFSHPDFVRKSQARAERDLAELAVPVINLGRGRHRCRRCDNDFDSVAQLHPSLGTQLAPPCPRCDAADFDVIEAFLQQLSTEK